MVLNVPGVGADGRRWSLFSGWRRCLRVPSARTGIPPGGHLRLLFFLLLFRLIPSRSPAMFRLFDGGCRKRAGTTVMSVALIFICYSNESGDYEPTTLLQT